MRNQKPYIVSYYNLVIKALVLTIELDHQKL